MSFNVDQIIITINSNIPNKEPFKLTNKSIYHPEFKDMKPYKFSQYPHIISERKYPMKDMYSLVRLGYKKVFRFFFDKKYFSQKLMGFYKNELNTSIAPVVPGATAPLDEPDNEDEILKFNVKVMLQLLFPTTFPARQNITDSYDEFILQKTDTSISFKALFSEKDIGFSYLKMGSKIYTVSKVTWLNDLFNNELYRSFIDNFINFSNWASKETKAIDNLIQLRYDKLLDKMKDGPGPGLTQKRDNLYINYEIANFESNRITTEIAAVDIQKKSFQENIEDIIILLKDVTSITSTIGNAGDNLTALYQKMKDINELYNALKKNTSVKLKGITDDFKTKLTKILEECKSISILYRIQKNYLSPNEFNIR